MRLNIISEDKDYTISQQRDFKEINKLNKKIGKRRTKPNLRKGHIAIVAKKDGEIVGYLIIKGYTTSSHFLKNGKWIHDDYKDTELENDLIMRALQELENMGFKASTINAESGAPKIFGEPVSTREIETKKGKKTISRYKKTFGDGIDFTATPRGSRPIKRRQTSITGGSSTYD